jgi:hypothetical protein
MTASRATLARVPRTIVLVESPPQHPGPRWTACWQGITCVSGVGVSPEAAVADLEAGTADFQRLASKGHWSPIPFAAGPLRLSVHPPHTPWLSSSKRGAVRA